MEFDEGNIKPESDLTFLQHQVEEQSDVCDFAVKFNKWERFYHRCVLMKSPFFECVLKNNFLEKYSGTVSLKCGTPTSIDMALMFLYGKKPILDNTNIEDMIDLAEFFLIPNLKSACVSWLRRQPICEENCLFFIQMSSKYGFELLECTTYLESHLNEVLLQTSSLTLTFKSINYIFTEKKFCYFQMEDRLCFLIRWHAAHPEKRTECTKKLLESIAFEEISISCFNNLKRENVDENILHDVKVGLQDPNQLTDVIINKKYGEFLCFDLARDMWFKIPLDATNNTLCSGGIADTNPDVSEVYTTKDNYELITFNLVTSEMKTYNVVTNTGTGGHRSDIFHFRNNVCVICQLNQIRTKRPDYVHLASTDRPHRESAMYPFVSHLDFTPTYRDTTLVLIGKITGDEVRMEPIFSVADSQISTVTVNKDSVLAFIPRSKSSVLIYDTVSYTMNKLDIKTVYNDKLFPATNGFVIHNNVRCITILKTAGSTLSQKYKVTEYVFGDTPGGEIRYFYCYSNNTWFRYFRESNKTYFRFQCVDHRKFEEAHSPDNVVWNELSLPNEASACSKDTLGTMMHLIRLPRRLLRCHVDCPHCKFGNQRPVAEKSSTYYVEECNYYYDESDSDEYFAVDGKYDSDDSCCL